MPIWHLCWRSTALLVLLRSADQSRLVEPLTHKKYGERAFSVAGPKLWNALRDDVKKAETVCSFKSKLKTFYFKKHITFSIMFRTSSFTTVTTKELST